MNEIILESRNGKILANSLDVAEKFGKRHDHVLRDIATKIKLVAKNLNLDNKCFQQS